MYTFELPEVGEGVVEAEIVKWLISEGDTVSADQPICEIMTDKATIEISSPKSGLITKLHGEEGEIVQVHTPFVELDLEAAPTAQTEAATEKSSAEPAAQAAPQAPALPQPPKAPSKPKQASRPPSKSSSKTLASPAVRHYANQQSVDINAVSGTGHSGRVTREDIDRHAVPAFEHAPKIAPALQAPTPAAGEDHIVRIIGLRRKIAEKMVQSVQTAPHFTYVDEIDATALVEMRQQLKPFAEAKGIKITYLPFIMKALVEVFRDFPTINAVMNEAQMELVVRGTVNIGIATDTPNGLYVPVVHNVQSKSLLELAAELSDLTQRTREGKVSLSELSGGTFTITSVGNIGGRFATPIINHPEVAILGVNQIHDRPMVIDGAVVPRKMMYLSPSFDHRIIDGAVAARFVSALKKVLETPAALMLSMR